jgi:hypothetical protein
MKGRRYNVRDMERMQEALAIVTAYDMGTEPNEFSVYKELLDSSEDYIKDSLAQLAWVFLKSLEGATPATKEEVLAWYGQRFARETTGTDHD